MRGDEGRGGALQEVRNEGCRCGTMRGRERRRRKGGNRVPPRLSSGTTLALRQEGQEEVKYDTEQ